MQVIKEGGELEGEIESRETYIKDRVQEKNKEVRPIKTEEA